MNRSAGDPDRFLARYFAPELRAWRGQSALGSVFWLYGVAVSLGLTAITAMAIYSERWVLLQALVLVDLLYTGWLLVSIWRCAANAAPFWRVLAQWLVLAWGCNAAFVLFFLEVDVVLPHVSG